MKIRRLTGKGKEGGFALAEIMISAVRDDHCICWHSFDLYKMPGTK